MNMKTEIILFVILCLIGCTQKSEISSPQEITEVRVLPLPVSFMSDSISEKKYFAPPHNTRDSVFRNKILFPKDIRIARLPQRSDIQVVLVCNNTENQEHIIIQSYTLNKDNQIIDHLTLYSTEKSAEPPFTIKQNFEITNNYHFKVVKYLNALLIEQLFYKIDENGFFVEIRNGITPAVAYESMDNIYYMIESFIWDYNKEGGLYKKDNDTTYYRINTNGVIDKISKP